MPNWAKQLLWLLIALILLAHWREVGSWIRNLTRNLADILHTDYLDFHYPVYRFMVFGILVVAAVSFWAIWNNRSKGGQ